MLATASITEEILNLKLERRAVILAHHYQEAEIQDLADVVGDSLELSRQARELPGDVIAFCGVWFMAETAKILSPVKAESDILCTSRNAVAVVNSIPREKPILFLPDRNLGAYVKRQTGRENMRIWQGACIVHATFVARRLTAALEKTPRAQVVAHPECPQEVLALADFVGSTSAIIDWCARTPAQDVIVMTESGVSHSLARVAPGKRFQFIPNEQCNCSECPYMKRNTLEKLRDALRDLTPRVEIPAETIRRALLPLERMLHVG